MTTSDPYNLSRFVDAQRACFETALLELRAGAKRTHWMWFIFPQLEGLGRSPTAQLYAIGSLDEARAYFEHPVLGPRLRESVDALLAHTGQLGAEQILGPIDAAKLRSCLTLFEAASGEPLFGRALDAFFGGARDRRTLELLASA